MWEADISNSHSLIPNLSPSFSLSLHLLLHSTRLFTACACFSSREKEERLLLEFCFQAQEAVCLIGWDFRMDNILLGVFDHHNVYTNEG